MVKKIIESKIIIYYIQNKNFENKMYINQYKFKNIKIN